MNQEQQSILEQILESPPRSKLEAHADFIRTLRQRRKTYREIATLLAQHFNLNVHYSTIYDFLQIHKREIP